MANKVLALLYNPFAGDRMMPARLDEVIEVFQSAGYYVMPYRFSDTLGVEGFFDIAKPDAVCVCGGDGSVNFVLNALWRRGILPPLGIIPCGTANDFAAFMGLPPDPVEAAQIMAKGEYIDVDLGLCNDEVFINVCACGILATVSQGADPALKSGLGKLAYYIRGLQEFANPTPLPMRIEGAGIAAFEEELFLALALNTSGTGGFRDLSRYASVVDGKLEFIGIKARQPAQLAILFMRMLADPKRYLSDPNVIYFQSSEIRVTPLFDAARYKTTDLDGEKGPDLPVSIGLVPRGLRLFI